MTQIVVGIEADELRCASLSSARFAECALRDVGTLVRSLCIVVALPSGYETFRLIGG